MRRILADNPCPGGREAVRCKLLVRCVFVQANLDRERVRGEHGYTSNFLKAARPVHLMDLSILDIGIIKSILWSDMSFSIAAK